MKKQTISIDPSSFMGNAMDRTVEYIFTEDEVPLVIGKISRVARNRFKWQRYAKPLKHTTKAKVEPKAAEFHYVQRRSIALWAIRTSHHNATKGATK